MADAARGERVHTSISEEMERAHREDYEAKAKYDAAVRAIREILKDETAARRLSTQRGLVKDAMAVLERQSAHIVRVWD